MKLTRSIFLLASLPCLLKAGEPLSIDPAPPANRWRFGVSFAPIFNVDASFSGLGGFSSPFTPQPLGAGVNREYEDGYVFVDSSGNAGGATWNWGYENASQYNPAGAGSIDQHLHNSAANGHADEENQMAPAIEMFAYLDMGKVGDLSAGPVNWGFRGGVHYAHLSVSNSDAITSDVIRLTDSFSLGGGVVPGAPYQGSFNGPGPLLSDDPTRTTTVISNGALVQGRRELDVDMLTLSVGPYLEIPVAPRFSILAEAGVNVALVRGDYQFDSLTTLTGLGSQSTRGDDSRTVILPGLYAGVSATWKQSDSFSWIGSARYQYLDAFEITTGGSRATLDFDGAAVISIGGLWNY
ncbi:MAG: hypothetical protein QM755_21485 [Luteolibacter sp.]